MIYSFTLQGLGRIRWIVALVFAISSCLRLARFNVMLEDPARPEWKKDFFVGMPAPAGAVVGLLPVYLHFLDCRWTAHGPAGGASSCWLSAS